MAEAYFITTSKAGFYFYFKIAGNLLDLENKVVWDWTL